MDNNIDDMNKYLNVTVKTSPLERDHEYLKAIYPQIIRLIAQEIDNECDKYEYKDSCIFDEIPDKVLLDTIIDTIYQRVKDYDKDDMTLQMEDLSYNPLAFMPYRRSCGLHCPPPCSDYSSYGRPNWLRCLVGVMLYNELAYRRCRYRNFYGCY